MKTVVTTLVTVLVAVAVAPVAAGESAATQPDAIDRLILQEHARRNDPALSAKREWAFVGIADPWLGARMSGPVTNTPVAPSIEVVDPGDGFDWLDALVGAAAGAALLAASAGVGLAVRTRGPRSA